MNSGQALDATALAVYQAIWEKGFEDLDYRVLEVAFRKTLRECKFWPVKVADVRAHIDQANANGLKLEAEEAWRAWVKHVDRHYHPDLGWDHQTPPLPAITEHAARAAGGAFWVSTCPESDIPWATKRFIESYTFTHETGQVQNLLTRGEAKKILKCLTCEAAPKTKTLLAPTGSAPISAPLQQSDSATAASDHARVKINAPRPEPMPLSVEEMEHRKEDLLEQFNRYLQVHPELNGQAEAAD